MSNVVKFKRPPKPKEPMKLSPTLRKALIWLAVVVALAAVWTWFHLNGG